MHLQLFPRFTIPLSRLSYQWAPTPCGFVSFRIMILSHTWTHKQRFAFHKHRANVRICVGGGLYSILGVPYTASKQEIKAAYRRLAQVLHPDKNTQSQENTTAAFIRCRLAYEILANTQKRQEYDSMHLNAATHQAVDPQPQPDPYSTSTVFSSACSSAQSSSINQQPADPSIASAAVAAAGANSSGFSSHALTCRTQHPAGTSHVPFLQPSSSATARQLLLERHDAVLEQFDSMQEALSFLQQLDQQQELLGLAAEDYCQHQGLSTAGSTPATVDPFSNAKQSSRCDKVPPGTQQQQQQQRWGGFNPGEFVPAPKS